MEVARHETCPQYVARRLSEGWRITRQEGFLVVLESPEGIIRPVDLRNDIQTLRPNGAGASTAFNYYDGGSYGPDPNNNWKQVDEAIADNDSTYVHRFAGAGIDFYNIANPTFADSVINKVTVYCRCRQHSAGSHCGYYGIKSGATESWNLKAFGVGWSDYNTVYTTDPNTGVAWIKAAITTLQVGVQIKDETYNGITCTQIYVEVDYTLVVPWSGKISGVTNPAKIMGIPVANIAKVKGVA